ncbi:hypothetical protein N657DRAFT_101100 [Parathielavia appendiculata]|uniref:Uncharacterized protein n=1 Tax=Parathielavia appendiculata TaxID=2587402 RepID=A0AAN6Z1Z1_9PEZI|nr:hypothetical protein N657DRAFT_101100 [Parathielavia appendiculata]
MGVGGYHPGLPPPRPPASAGSAGVPVRRPSLTSIPRRKCAGLGNTVPGCGLRVSDDGSGWVVLNAGAWPLKTGIRM